MRGRVTRCRLQSEGLRDAEVLRQDFQQGQMHRVPPDSGQLTGSRPTTARGCRRPTLLGEPLSARQPPW
ncbi:hypothetical protein GCM10010217_47230 [Streptomyces tubercidicus]